MMQSHSRGLRTVVFLGEIRSARSEKIIIPLERDHGPVGMLSLRHAARNGGDTANTSSFLKAGFLSSPSHQVRVAQVRAATIIATAESVNFLSSVSTGRDPPF